MKSYIRNILMVSIMSMTLSCGTNQVRDTSNPLLEEWDTPFAIAPFERIKPHHYLEAFDVAFEEQRADIERIVRDTSDADFGSVIFAFDQSGIRVSELKDLFEMSEAAISDADYQAVSEQVYPKISAERDSILMNDALFQKIKAVYDRRKTLSLDSEQMRLVEKIYMKFARGGAELDAEGKARLAAINGEMAQLNSRFSSNLIKENAGFVLELQSTDMDGLPIDIKQSAREEAMRRGLKEKYVFTLNPASMIPFLTYSTERELREELYRAYLSRGANGGESDNREIVRRVTELRQERAALLGYDNHADYVISQQMAGSVDAVYDLLDKVWEPALERAVEERKRLQLLLNKDIEGAKLEPWDWWHYAEQVRSRDYKLSSEDLRAYFTIEGARAGAFALANRLYGITFRPIDAPLYDQSCDVYEVLDRDNTHLGVLYFDLLTRAGKGQGAWCGNLREQRTDGGDRITPVVAIVCNFTPPTEDMPSLLNLEQVETLFHEFGHALHFIFQNVDYRGLAAVEGDFVEFPSQVMENWATEPELLAHYAVHYKKGEPMPKELMDNIQKSREFNGGYETLSFIGAALLDLDLQTLGDMTDFDIESFERESLREKRGLIDEIEPRYHLPYFSHLFTYDYSAGYYFYIWAEVLEKDCFEHFRRSGDIFSQELAAKLRREVLQRGGEADGMTLYRNFKGSDATQDAMLKSRGL